MTAAIRMRVMMTRIKKGNPRRKVIGYAVSASLVGLSVVRDNSSGRSAQCDWRSASEGRGVVGHEALPTARVELHQLEKWGAVLRGRYCVVQSTRWGID